ncbi:poly(U)-specific endoribonuclease-like isoform X2 [Asterias rubens]|uniref:poly(U)-specific endoribonuclease-like isoform X2 n=1 Tax=Asterias rubens TaxID=7604 RepID=UPI00145528DD|nr:poly(U)-specific endoribonuclease-like isoform X2 [Asterias rubens]XP_033645029.1 poly(U)-specific endoribonuclease-like isoform X2 [Asterias rubens]XP_033645030.1 poly(U)-specific endoribonuclease-like isoform X2 [Asterias rubens]
MDKRHFTTRPVCRHQPKMKVFALVCVALLLSLSGAASSSCYNRCGNSYSGSYSCQCNSNCARYRDCCSDYVLHCQLGSCQGRCETSYDGSKPCQCNTSCDRYGDCCVDYETQCSGDSPVVTSAPSNPGDGSAPTDMDEFATAVWNADVNRLSSSDYSMNVGTYISNSGAKQDVSSNPMFTSVNTAFFQRDTYKTLISLFDNYITSQGQSEVTTALEQAEQDAFMDAMFDTTVMSIAYQYVKSLGYYSTLSQYKEFVRGLIFTPYTRKASKDTSGFEHVFTGEFSDSSSVSGFHNWVRMYLLEQEGVMNYYGYMNIQEPNQILYQFEWENRVKPITSIMHGVSPEFEMAIFSTCFLTRRNAVCDMTINGGSASVQTWDYNGADVFGSAYFIA